MLALPVSTGVSGFIPSIVMMGVCWLAMTVSALLLMEVSLWMEEGAHVITMAERLLGKWGKVIAWLLFLFISYGSLVGYAAGAGMQIAHAADVWLGIKMGKAFGVLAFIIFFGASLFFGSRVVGRLNAVVFIGMILAYFGVIGMGLDEVKPALLRHRTWTYAFMALPLLLTTFSFQTLVPSLTPYLQRHAKSLRLAIVLGTTMTFVVYLVWQCLILGIVPVDGPDGLAVALLRGEPATDFVSRHVDGWGLNVTVEFFAFFAIITSFLGIGLGLFDFLADGLHIKERGLGMVWLGALIVVPTYFCAVYFERAFIIMFDTTGGVGDTILNGIFPALMVWKGRYRLGYSDGALVGGGKFLLVAVIVVFASILLLECLMLSGVLASVIRP